MDINERWSEIAEGMANEEAEEAKLSDLGDGHAETSGGSQTPPPEEVDELLDGMEGGPGHSGECGESSNAGEMPSVPADETGGDISEVEGYESEADLFNSQYPEIVHGTDNRVRVWNTRPYPWRTICDLEITAADGSRWQCSGSMIGPRTVLTNGHCVFMHGRGGWVRSIRVIPGRNGSSEPFGSATSSFYHSVKGWTTSRSSNYDYAAIVLPSNRKLGNTVGWMGLANLSFFSLLGLRVNNSGYPGDKGGSTQWWNANNILAVTSRRVYYRIDTAGGQSGSPVWRYKNRARHIVAVHNTGGAVFNGGVRLSKPVFNNLVKWKNQYL